MLVTKSLLLKTLEKEEDNEIWKQSIFPTINKSYVY